MPIPYRQVLRLGLGVLLAAFPLSIFGQTNTAKAFKATSIPSRGDPALAKKVGESVAADSANETNAARDPLNMQRRAFAISLITSLAEEARSYHDQSLRPNVLARAANSLWDVDSEMARQLFRRAWAAAEVVDAEGGKANAKDAPPAMITALRRIGGRDLRLQVLGLAARRDRALGDEFLAKLKEETKREAADLRNDASARNTNDSWLVSDAVSKRLLLATTLLEDGQIEQALEVAAPALDQVNQKSIGFLSALRKKKPEAADQRYALLLARAELDASSDANTASGLSSYAFTPGLYLTFSPEGGIRWTPSAEPPIPPNLPPALRYRFFQVAGSILLRPLPPPEEDFTSSGRTGRYQVIRRLLPLFEQFAPDTALALRSRLAALAGEGGTRVTGFETPLVAHGIQPEENPVEALEKLQDRVDRAQTSRERDRIYADAAGVLANQGNAHGQDLAERIEESDRRSAVRRYVDFQLVRYAIRQKDATEVARFAKVGQLSHSQRAWAYTQAAGLVLESERPRALRLIDDAIDEARRMDVNDSNRAHLLLAVATQLVTADRSKAWELMSEIIKSGNAAETFTGENTEIYFPTATSSGLTMSPVGGEEFGLTGVFGKLAKEDLYRSIDLAKSFKKDAPRATATLAIARAVLDE